jgi:hypothetical protein
MSPVAADEREMEAWSSPALAFAEDWAKKLPLQRLTPLSSVAFMVAAVPLLWHLWTTLHGYFTQDDYVYIYRAAHQPLSLHYLFSSYNGHIIPGEFLLAWVVTRLAPMNWPVAVLPLLAMQAFATFLLWRLFHGLFGDRWGILVPFAIFCLSPILLVTPLWWAFALEIVPFLVCALGAMGAVVRHIQTGRRSDALACVAYVVVGLIFWEKIALIVPLLFALALVLAPPGNVKSAFLSTLKRARWLWTTLAAVLGVYAIAYLRLAALDTRSGLPAKHLPELAGLMIRELIGWLIGGPWGHTITGSAPRGAAFALYAVITVLVIGAALVLRGKRAALAWSIVLAYLAIDVFLVAFARLSGAGPIIGQDPRYIADVVPVVLIFGALAFLEPRRMDAADEPATPAGRGTVLAIVGAVAVVAIVSTAAAQASQLNHKARAFRANAIQSLKENGRPAVFDGGLPNGVMLTEFGSEARVSRVLGPAVSLARLDAPTDDLVTFDSSGFLESFEFYFPAAAVTRTTTGSCAYGTTSDGVAIPFQKPVKVTRAVVKLTYSAATTTKGFVQAGRQRIPVTFSPSQPRSLFVVARGPLSSVTVGSASPVCVSAALAGGPTPVEPRTPSS